MRTLLILIALSCFGFDLRPIPASALDDPKMEEINYDLKTFYGWRDIIPDTVTLIFKKSINIGEGKSQIFSVQVVKSHGYPKLALKIYQAYFDIPINPTKFSYEKGQSAQLKVYLQRNGVLRLFPPPPPPPPPPPDNPQTTYRWGGSRF